MNKPTTQIMTFKELNKARSLVALNKEKLREELAAIEHVATQDIVSYLKHREEWQQQAKTVFHEVENWIWTEGYKN